MIRTGLRLLALTAIAAVSISTTALAAAPAPVLSDPLSDWPLNFGAQGPQIMLKDGAVHIAVPASSANWVLYSGFTFKDMDASITVTPGNTTGSSAALIFWAANSSDFFTYGVSEANGTFAVYHHTPTGGGSWQAIVPYTKGTGIKPTGANVLRIVTKGNRATLYVNGQSLGGVSMMAPPDGGMVGLEAEGGKGPSDYAFSNLTVSQ